MWKVCVCLCARANLSVCVFVRAKDREKSLVSENVQSNRCSLISFFFNFYKKNFIRKILNIAIMTPNVSIRNDIFSLGYFIHMHIIYIVSSKWLNSLRR